jgi:hypothetical protein
MQNTSKLSALVENDVHTALIWFNKESLLPDTDPAETLQLLTQYLRVDNPYPMFKVVVQACRNLVSSVDFSLPKNRGNAQDLADFVYTLGHNRLLAMPYLVKLLQETFTNVLPQNNFLLAQTVMLFIEHNERFTDRVGFADLQRWKMEAQQIPDVNEYIEAQLAVEY